MKEEKYSNQSKEGFENYDWDAVMLAEVRHTISTVCEECFARFGLDRNCEDCTAGKFITMAGYEPPGNDTDNIGRYFALPWKLAEYRNDTIFNADKDLVAATTSESMSPSKRQCVQKLIIAAPEMAMALRDRCFFCKKKQCEDCSSKQALQKANLWRNHLSEGGARE